MNAKKIYRITKVVIILYCTAGIVLYYMQSSFIFHPEKLDSGYLFSLNMPFEEVKIPISNTDTTSLLHFIASSKPKGIVIYFHGNRDNINRYFPNIKTFIEKGYDVWMFDYPGFGKSRGALTEDNIYKHASQVCKRILAVSDSTAIIMYGKSLGTGIASYCAKFYKPSLLILETPYYSIESVFKYYAPIYPVSLMCNFIFPTHQFLRDVKCKIVAFHGTDDGVIPYSNAIRLKNTLKRQDEFITIKNASHNNIYQTAVYQKKIKQLFP